MPSDANKVAPQDMKDVHLKWDDIEHEVDQLAFELRRINYVPERIIGIVRGGMLPAVMLSHRIGCPKVKTVQLQIRDGNARLGYVPRKWNTPDTLVIDDLWDSGDTIRRLHEHLFKATFATLYHRITPLAEHQKFVKIPGSAVPRDLWLVFPWEQAK